jgi:hypothetical protein
MDHDAHTQLIVIRIIEDAHNIIAGREVEHFDEDDPRYQDIVEVAEWITNGQNVTTEYVIDRWNNQDSASRNESGNNQDSSSQSESENSSDNSESSLIDDYADPNLEQPSHMDPDD